MFRVASNKPPVSSTSNAGASSSTPTTAGASFEGRTVSIANQRQSASFLAVAETTNRSAYRLSIGQNPTSIPISDRNVQQPPTLPLIPTREAPPPPTESLTSSRETSPSPTESLTSSRESSPSPPPSLISSREAQQQFLTSPLVPTREAPPPPTESLMSNQETQQQQHSSRFSIVEGASNNPAYESGSISEQYEDTVVSKPEEDAQPPERPPGPLKYDYPFIGHKGLPGHPKRFAIGDVDPHKPEYENVLKIGMEGGNRPSWDPPKRFNAFSTDDRDPQYENVANINDTMRMVRNPKVNRQTRPQSTSDKSGYSTLKYNKGEDEMPPPLGSSLPGSNQSTRRSQYESLPADKTRDASPPPPELPPRSRSSIKPLSDRGGYSTLKYDKGEDEKPPPPNPSLPGSDQNTRSSQYESLPSSSQSLGSKQSMPTDKARKASPPPPELPPRPEDLGESERPVTPPPLPKRTYQASPPPPQLPPKPEGLSEPQRPATPPPLPERTYQASPPPPLPERTYRTPPPQLPPKPEGLGEPQRSATPPPVPKRTNKTPETSGQEVPAVPPRPSNPSVAPPLPSRSGRDRSESSS